jgi:hypothetical protein
VDAEVDERSDDPAGANGWGSLADVFAALNTLTTYAVLRNFEGLPESHVLGEHDDVDLLVDDYRETIRVLRARPLYGWHPRWGGRFHVSVAGSSVIFDIRFVGDGYFDADWQRQVLERRVLTAGGIHALSDPDYFETLAYHALLHKPRLSDDYRRRLTRMAAVQGRPEWTDAALREPAAAAALLRSIMAPGRDVVRPRDVTVFYNYRRAGVGFPLVHQKLAGLRRKLAIRLWPVRGRLLTIRRRAMHWIGSRLPGLRQGHGGD